MSILRAGIEAFGFPHAPGAPTNAANETEIIRLVHDASART
jgi:hypothetical protein